MNADELRRLWEEGQRDEALKRALAAREREDEDTCLEVSAELIACANDTGHGPVAEEAHRIAALLRAKAWAPDHPRGAYASLPYAFWLQDEGRFEDAERLLRDALALAEQRRTHDPVPLRDVRTALGRLAALQGDLDTAASWYEQAVDAERARARPEAIELRPLLGELSAIQLRRARIPEAAAAMSERVGLSKTLGKKPTLDDVHDLRALADLREKEGRSGDAAALRERADRIEKAARRRR